MDSKTTDAAVLVLRDLSQDVLLLTKRSEDLKHHPGEISFPGGLWESTDKDMLQTALRETWEELGIAQDRIQNPTMLPLEKTFWGTTIHPFYATIATIEPVKINTIEVSEVLYLPWNDVINPDNYEQFPIQKGSFHFKSCRYTASSEHIWGATARIMRSLITQK